MTMLHEKPVRRIATPVSPPTEPLTAEQVLYFDRDAEQTLKASEIPSLSDAELLQTIDKVRSLQATLKAERARLNKLWRHRELASSRPIRKIKSWQAKAGCIELLLCQERSKRKRTYNAALQQCFIEAARTALPPDVFEEVLSTAIELAQQ